MASKYISGNSAQEFRTAQGARILFTIPGRKRGSVNVSSRQLKCYWPDLPREDTTIWVLIEDKTRHSIVIKHMVVVAHTREQTQYRFVIQSSKLLFEAMNVEASDLVGIAVTDSGEYVAEKNTAAVKACHKFFFSPKEPRTTAATAKVPKQPAPPKEAKQRPEVPSNAEPEAMGASPKPKRRRIGGSGGRTMLLREGKVCASDGADEPAEQRLMEPLTNPPRGPMSLLPGEHPLEIERYFGEGRAAEENASGSGSERPKINHRTGGNQQRKVPSNDPGISATEPPLRYGEAVQRAREGMAAKAREIGGTELEDYALSLACEFERLLLSDEGSRATAAKRKQVCIDYDAVLRRIYPHLVLDPHILSVRALEEWEGDDDLQLLRCMERRFMIWRQEGTTALQPLQCNGSPQPQPPRPSSRTGQIINYISSIWPLHRTASDHKTQQEKGPRAGQAGQATGDGAPSRWVDGLQHIWNAFTSRMGNKQYGGIDLGTAAETVSCALNDTLWWNGQLIRRPVPPTDPVLPTVDAARKAARPGNPRLYLTDGSMPDYEGRKYPRWAPGMPCLVDAMSNAMFPHAVRSSRATNLFHFLKNESTGTGTFTLFCAVGRGANLTAFHFETKRRRSYNLATGDYIIQPLAAAANARAVMRIHAAIAGRHSRHGQLLPLECYLEEGVTLVTHVRDYPSPTLSELCEQSLHAFITFDDATVDPPPLKVSCNDFDLVWDIDATYFMEILSTAYAKSGLLNEEAPPPDGADTWIQSCYLLAEPWTLKAAQEAGWERPWACEVRPNIRKAGMSPGWSSAGDGRGKKAPVQDGDLDCSMDVIVVRTAEKLIDVLDEKLAPEVVAPWVGEVPSTSEATEALKRLVPVLRHMLTRSFSEEESKSSGNGTVSRMKISSSSSQEEMEDDTKEERASRDPRFDCHFSQEYIKHLLERISKAGVSINDKATQVLLPRAIAASNGEDVAALGKLPAKTLRQLWMQRLSEERSAAVARPVNLGALAAARRRRGAVEAAFDLACCGLVQQHAQDWGAAEVNDEAMLVTID